MKKQSRKAIIISASSDIGHAMCLRWKKRGWEVYGTFRTKSPSVDELNSLNIKLVHCDVADDNSVQDACVELRKICPKWDVLVMCPGSQDPVGMFNKCSFDEWERSMKVNCINQLRVVHGLLQARGNKEVGFEPCVIFFAGGGTNGATLNYSAYTVSKIALIKMCELLDAEIPDTSFVIVGPGWVKTKIHNSTVKARMRAGDNYQRTIDMLASSECTPMGKVLDCCDWIINSERGAVSGRNFSVVFDSWGSQALEKQLLSDKNMYKLRRSGNDAKKG